MGEYRAIETLAEFWPGIRGELDKRTFARLQELVTRFATAAAGRLANPRDLLVLLTDSLPADHPIRAALREDEHRAARGAATDPDMLVAWVNLVATLRGTAVPDDPLPTLDEVATGAAAWLLTAPAIDETSLGTSGLDPDDPDLIVLDRQDGSRQWPVFQFDEHGRLLDLVREINRILEVRDDPWGVADWWLGGNAWLGAAPVDLLGLDRDQDLLDAALDERAEG